MATAGLSASCISNREVIHAPQKRDGKTSVFALERMIASCLYWLLLILIFPCIAPAQDTFSGGNGSGASAVPTTYSDQFASGCEQSEPPNVFKQVGMNPLVCHGQVGPQDSQKQCSYAGMTMIAHIGETCYYCAPIVPPINGIIIPFDQVRQATSEGFSCGADQVDPDCMAICSKPGSLDYTPPSGSGNTPNPVPVTGGPPTNQSGPMPGPAGGIGFVPGPNPCIAGGGYNYCNNGPGARLPPGCICNNQAPGQPVTIVSQQQNYEPIPHKPLKGTSDICKEPPTEPGNAKLNDAWYLWCTEWQELVAEKVMQPLLAKFGHVPSPNNGYQDVQITYQANVRITKDGQATVVGRYLFWSSDNNRTGLAFAKEAASLFNQLKGQVPPFPAGSNRAWFDRSQSYGINHATP